MSIADDVGKLVTIVSIQGRLPANRGSADDHAEHNNSTTEIWLFLAEFWRLILVANTPEFPPEVAQK